MTVDWFDSAFPPNASQCAQAKAAGIAGWAGYFKFGNDGILNGWALSDFQRVQAAGLRTIAYVSGWASPTVARAQSLTWDVEICLDVEGGIRGDGGWVQGWLDAAQSGLYGNWGCHAGRAAAFHVLAAYPTSGDPSGASWWAQSPRPGGLCGWQWAGSHSWAGITVDSSWFDDGIANGLFGPGSGSIGEISDLTPEQDATLTVTSNKVNEIWDLLRNGVHDPANPDWIRTELEGLKADVTAIAGLQLTAGQMQQVVDAVTAAFTAALAKLKVTISSS